MKSTSELILENLVHNQEYTQRVLPHLKEEYFDTEGERLVFRQFRDFHGRYNSAPTVEALFIEISNQPLKESDFASVQSTIDSLKEKTKEPNIDWLIETSENFCQDKALYIALQKAIKIYDGEEKKLAKGAIPGILQEALGTTFTTSIGHDYIDDAEARFAYYHQKEVKIPFDLSEFNRATKNGYAKRTFNLYVGATHGGKTALMCHQAAANLSMGKNVLYITLEMREEEISKRIDANLMDISLNDLMELDYKSFMGKINRIKTKTMGRLKVKEYATGTASVIHFTSLLNDYKLKSGFFPDVVYIDYLNLCASSRFKYGAENSYTLMKSVSEELRGFAQIQDIAVVSATQFNRTGMSSSDPEATDVSESIGVLFTADFSAALVAPPDLIANGQIMIKQIKNRYEDMNKMSKFFVGFDRSKMKFYDLDSSTKEKISLPWSDDAIDNALKPSETPSISQRAMANIKKPKFQGFDYEK